jgi:hypothetical protein
MTRTDLTRIRRYTASLNFERRGRGLAALLVAIAAALAIAGPAQAAERLTAREARAAVTATNETDRALDLAQTIAFVRSDVGGPALTTLESAERIGPRRIRFAALVTYRSTATGDTFDKRAPVTIVKRTSGRLIARSTVVLPDGDAFVVGYSFRLEAVS